MSASGTLEIIKAHYGCNGTLDVTDKCKKIAAENNGAFIIDAKADFNQLFGDPEPGKSKKLTVLYRYGNGYQQQQMWGENHGLINLVGLSLTNGGVLTLNVHRAVDLRDSRTFGTQNPYCELSCGGEKFTTKTHDKGGKNPAWGQIFTFNLDGKDQYMHVFIKDKEIGTDSVIGRLDIHLPVLCAAKGEVAYPVIHPMDFKKQCGTIVLTASFVDKNAAAAATTTATASSPTAASASAAAAAPAAPAAAAAAAAAAPMVMSPQPQVIYQQPQPQVIYQQPQVVYQPPVVQQPQVVYQQPQVVYQQPVPTPAPAPVVVVAAPAPAVVVAAPAVALKPTQICKARKQDGWRWCTKCMAFWYIGIGKAGTCPAGGGHDAGPSSKYYPGLDSGAGCNAQGGWQWCNSCMVMCNDGGRGVSSCPANSGGAHTTQGEYFICRQGIHGQEGWRWCINCGVLWHELPGRSKCPATGGEHNSQGSSAYQLAHD